MVACAGIMTDLSLSWWFCKVADTERLLLDSVVGMNLKIELTFGTETKNKWENTIRTTEQWVVTILLQFSLELLSLKARVTRYIGNLIR